ncbi:MAG: hypothetical protein OQK98_06635 [Gammaproteobacteria bacterium]|nr:hypothetical protein [Gammaproteobacteria bacterium]
MHARQFSNIEETAYPAIRRSFNTNQAYLDDQQLEIYVSELFPGSSAEDVENFMRSLQRFGRQVAPVAQRALPGIIQGAAQGGTVAGPWGALAGAVGGGAASLLSGRGRSRPQSQPQRPQQPASPAQPAAPATATAVSSMAPIQQLLALLSRPETMQALSALLMSSAGRSHVSVGNQSAPAAAFANAIAELAAEAAEAAYSESPANISEYLIDSDGSPRCDLVNSAERAHLLLADISAVATQEYLEDEYYDDYEDDLLDDDGDDDDEEVDADFDNETTEDEPLDDYVNALYGRSYQ